MTTLARARRRTVRAAAPSPALRGIVTGIVAVTGHEDSVKDVIVPGAFKDTLKRLRPKLCWHHDWKDPLGSVLHIEELRPGDKRLPKVLPDGRPFPREAGALLATMQFNLETARGREMFAHCKEWAKTGEAAFSIGYRVVDGMASKRADGVRLIYALDLYEVSLVLHGAHNMALALEVKDASGIPGMEVKDSPTGVTEVKAAEPMIGNGAMVALYIDPEVASGLVVEDGNPAEELHVTLAFLGDGDSISEPQALAEQLAAAVAGAGPLTGQLGGIGVFPAGENGTPVWVPVDVPGVAELRHRVVGALSDAGYPQRSEHGFTPHMTLGYDLPALDPVDPTPVSFDTAYLVIGEERIPLPLTEAPMEGKAHDALTAALAIANRLGLEEKSGVPGVADTPSDLAAVERLRKSWSHGTMAAKIGWGTGGDFDRCVALATEHMGPEEAKGWCNLRHHDALGMYPATHAKLEGKSLPKKQKCKYGDEPATQRIIHAEGMAYIPVCDKHLEQGKTDAAKATPDGTSDPSNIDAIRPIEGKAHAVLLEVKNLFGGSAGTVTVPTLTEPEKVSGVTKKAKRRTPEEEQETKAMPRMRGSYEERRGAIERALEDLFVKDEKHDDRPCSTWVSVDATFDDHVIATVYEDNDQQAYRVGYSFNGEDAALDKPVKVNVEVVAFEEGETEPVDAEEGEAVQMRFIDPTVAALEEAAKRMTAMPEGKSLDGIEEPLLRLMDALAFKGMDVAGVVMGDEPEPDDEEAEPVPDDEAAEGEAPAPDDEAAEPAPDDEESEGETVSIDPADVQADLESIA